MRLFRRSLWPWSPRMGRARLRSYGSLGALVQTVALVVTLAVTVASGVWPASAAERPLTIVALGDSLTAGLGLPVNEAFPAKLEAALRATGRAVTVVNAGVSGETASGGLSRLGWSVPEGTEAVILELGANDMLRGLDPKVTRTALDAILRRLSERKIPVLIAGMRAAPNLGADYVKAFEAIYPELAAKYDALFYPFFLEGAAANAALNQRDGLHPTAAGVDVIVAGILPKVEELLARAQAQER